MTKPFVPFDKFEKSCSPMGKPLAESMAASCNDRLAPESPTPCADKPCPPFWQRTCEIRCLDNGMIDAEEIDGCGNTRWVRTTDVVVWEDSDEDLPCVDPLDENEPIYRTQTNQCGETRQVPTGRMCCVPEWIDVEPAVINCETFLVRYEQVDGCGNERLRSSSEAVAWVDTTNRRCLDGFYQREEINQCGTVRWTTINEYVWEDTGETRCVGSLVEKEQINQCDMLRWVSAGVAIAWVDTTTERCITTHEVEQVNQCGAERWDDRGAIIWVNTGETRCSETTDNVENEQSNQCGDLRWVDTGVACTSPAAVMPATTGGGCYVGTASGGSESYILRYNSNGTGSRTTPIGDGTAPFTWAPSTVDGADYEIMVDYDFAGSGASYFGPTEGVWTSLATVQQMEWRVTGPTPSAAILTGTVSIRRVGEVDPDDSTEILETFISIDVECP